MDTNEIFDLPLIERERSSESDFISDLIHVSNYSKGVFLCVSHLVIEKEMTELEKGILMGFMTNAYKLYDSPRNC